MIDLKKHSVGELPALPKKIELDLTGCEPRTIDIPLPPAASSPNTVPGGMKNCPFCAETIKDEAIKCRFCGELLFQSTEKLTTKKHPKTPIQSINKKKDDDALISVPIPKLNTDKNIADKQLKETITPKNSQTENNSKKGEMGAFRSWFNVVFGIFFGAAMCYQVVRYLLEWLGVIK